MAILSALRLHSAYVSGKKYDKNVDLNGKVFIVTGCNTGIGLGIFIVFSPFFHGIETYIASGFETAKALVAMNGIVIMASRSPDKAHKAKQAIIEQTNCSPTKVWISGVDCSSNPFVSFTVRFACILIEYFSFS